MTTAIVEFSVPGVPVGQPRPRAQLVRGKARPFVHMYTPGERVKPWKDLIGLHFARHQPAEPWTGPVKLSLEAFFPRPQRLLKRTSPSGALWMSAKPDLDNVLKAVMDALTWSEDRRRGLWRDDAQVVAYGPTGKWYAAIGCEPGIRVRCELLEQREELFPCSC